MANITALIAEDVEVMRRLLKNALASYHCDVVAEVESGDDVIAGIDAASPDIVFLDINMPGKNGLEVLRDIRQRDQQIFVAMVSGYSNFDNVKAALEGGANGFIVKPFTAVKVQEMLEKYRAARQGGPESTRAN